MSTSLNGFFPVNSRDWKIIRDTQKKIMSYPVTRASVGKYRLKSGASSSGHPIVEKGHKAELNHVSKTSVSCSQFSSSSGASFPTYTSPRSEEHTSELQSRGHLVCRLLLEK